MGLFKFLKEKFSKKKDEKIENPSEPYQNEENFNIENNNENILNDKNLDEKNAINSIEIDKNDEINETISEVIKEEEIKKEIEAPIPNKSEIKKEDASKYDKGMEKSRESFSKRIKALSKKFKSKHVNQEYFDTLEEILIEADCGVNFTLNIIEELVDYVKKEKLTDVNLINEVLITKMFENYYKGENSNFNDFDFSQTPKVLLVVGVNGVGKTTSIAKLAYRYIKMNKKVLLVAGDTFRAGAKEQLSVWADRLNTEIIVGKENEDPASVAYKGVKYGKENNYDLIIVDTAGRLQNKTNLMEELKKIKRVIGKEILTPIDCYLILDATTGQNGVLQAKAFKDLIDVNGIVITKMDGTSKGGIILAIKEELNIPVKFIGLGEKIEDLEVFDLNKYLYGLCKELIAEDE